MAIIEDQKKKIQDVFEVDALVFGEAKVVAIMAESREGRAQRFLFIQRDSAGRFTGFGTSLLPQIQEIEGRFAGLLPPSEPTDEMAMAARNLLQAMGVAIERAGNDPKWN